MRRSEGSRNRKPEAAFDAMGKEGECVKDHSPLVQVLHFQSQGRRLHHPRHQPLKALLTLGKFSE